jgi:hypothetical protein
MSGVRFNSPPSRRAEEGRPHRRHVSSHASFQLTGSPRATGNLGSLNDELDALFQLTSALCNGGGSSARSWCRSSTAFRLTSSGRPPEDQVRIPRWTAGCCFNSPPPRRAEEEAGFYNCKDGPILVVSNHLRLVERRRATYRFMSAIRGNGFNSPPVVGAGGSPPMNGVRYLGFQLASDVAHRRRDRGGRRTDSAASVSTHRRRKATVGRYDDEMSFINTRVSTHLRLVERRNGSRPGVDQLSIQVSTHLQRRPPEVGTPVVGQLARCISTHLTPLLRCRVGVKT